MTDQIKTVTDKSNFEKILNKFFLKNNVFLKTKNGDLKIQYIGYSEDTAAFKIPFIKNISGNCIIFTWQDNYRIHALAKFLEKQEDNMFIFAIDKFQILFKARGEDRKSLDEISSSGTKNIIFATNLISYSIIQNSIALETKKIDRIREFVKKDMSEAFNFSKIFFCNEGKGDVRMQYFFQNKKPIFIPHINNTNTDSSAKTKENFYLNSIYSKDYFLQGKTEYISEISVPLLYKLKMPYGYIQINNTSMLTSSALLIAKKFALSVDELLNKENVFPQSKEKFIVSNISQNGLGIVFKERKNIRYFKENNLIYFDLQLPQNKTSSIMAKVRNITLLENNIIMVGCSIEEMDALSEVNYEEFIESLPVLKENSGTESDTDTEQENNTKPEQEQPSE